MKKDKTEKIMNVVNEYLRKRNYQTRPSSGEAPAVVSGILGLLESPSPNSYSLSTVSANHLFIEHQFARLKSWMMEASEPCRSELSQLLFPLFVHIFLELGASNGKGIANKFFFRNYSVFRVNRDYEQTLGQLIHTSEDPNLFRSLRSGKYQVKLSDLNTFNYLLRYLKNSNNPTIIQILSRNIEIVLEDGFVASNLFNNDLSESNSNNDMMVDESLDCTDDDRNSVQKVIDSVRALPHPGLSLALYKVINGYNGVCNATTSPNVEMLACGFEDSVVKIWSLTPYFPHGNQQPPKPIPILACKDIGVDDSIKSEASSANDEESNKNRQRKQTSGGEIWNLRGHTGPVYDVAFTHTSEHLLSVSEDTYMRLWDMADGQCVAKYSGHNYPITSVKVSDYSMHMATGSMDTTARLWDLEHLYALRVFAGHHATVSAVAFHPNCNYLATGAWDTHVRLWTVQTANCSRLLLGHKTPITSLAFAPHGKYLASGSTDGNVLIWDLAAGKLLADLTSLTTSDDHMGAVGGPPLESIVELSWSQDSSLLVVGSSDGLVRTLGLTTLESTSGGEASLSGNEVHTVACGNDSDTTLLHSTLTRHNYIVAVATQHLDK